MESEALDKLEGLSQVVENVSFLTWDLVGIVGIFVAILIYSYTAGKEESIPMMVAGYAAGFVFTFSSHFSMITDRFSGEPWMVSGIALFVLFAAFFWIIKTNSFFEPYVVPTGYEIATFTVGVVGLLIAVGLTAVPDDLAATLSPIVRTGFMSEIATTVWALVPVGTWIILRGDD